MDDNTLEIIMKYQKLAKSISGRQVLIKDNTMLPFLAYSISSETASIQVIELAIDTLFLFANNDSNVSELKETYGIFEALHVIKNREDLPICVQDKVLQLLKRIEQSDLVPAYCTRSKTKEALPKNERNTHLKPSKLITLHIHGLNKECRRELEITLIAIQGVLSVVLDVDHQRCCLRVFDLLTPIDIATTIFEKLKLEAKLVSRNRFGQEILQSLLETSQNDLSDFEDLPPYLQEEDSPIKKKAVSKMFIIEDNSSNWLSSTIDFFQKSFYW